MISLSSEPHAEVFARFSRGWFRLLARGHFSQAAASLDEPSSDGVRWSAESIQQALHDYSPQSAVTDPESLPPDPHQTLVAFSDGHGYTFACSVPFDGRWSDLTAQFEFLSRPAGFAVRLQDLHVL